MTTPRHRRRKKARARTDHALRCIVRIDTAKPHAQHCWEVKIIRPGNSFHRSFSDSRHGGRRRALLAAMKCRDVELKKRPPMSSYEQAIRPKKNNTSGIVGVRRATRVVSRGKKVWSYDVWAVTGTPTAGGKSKTKYFSTSEGVNKAKARAIAQRKAWELSLRKSVSALERL